MSDVSGLRTAQTPQPHPERVEPTSSVPYREINEDGVGTVFHADSYRPVMSPAAEFAELSDELHSLTPADPDFADIVDRMETLVTLAELAEEDASAAGSAPTPFTGAPSLGAHLDRVPPQISFPIWAHDDMARAPQAGTR